MTQPAPRSRADVVISILLLVATALMGALAAFLGLFSLAFLDHCPPATCSVDGAVTAVFTALAAAAGIGLIGLVLTVVALVRRASAWPYALATLCCCALSLFLGVVRYGAAVG
ncbi:hypothetical protein FK535_13895 [Mycolicibacterium sp. 018/SC-01/001]|uniref:hypothetical protein n=1 Tax=Mycolicibacterium sp. 018/SC-01/001 TaxID=2592069 RepID=UPI00117E48AF|nr:hypothetical protein [Mycolicibacterium sp. 018/SC-01/001]TRW82470.1 hypothetical protein FK535_13895 [Mycolicibacterium sp. 018/SC-01/001]